MKKLFSVFLCLILVIVMLPVTALPAKAMTSGDWEYTQESGGRATITKYNGTGTEVSIPSSLGGYKVTAIGQSAFKWKTSLVSVMIPSTVVSIGNSAFAMCSSLQSITIPSSVTSIGDSAFQDCSSLSDAVIMGGITRIASYTFYGCDMLQTVTIPSSVTGIGGYAFFHCGSLNIVNFGGSMPQWKGLTVDNGNDDLAAATICYASGTVAASGICGRNGSDSVVWTLDNVGTMTVSGTGEMSGYSYANTPWYSFRGAITSLVIAPGVTNIGPYAFYDCDNLADVSFPSGLTAIGSDAFAYCRSLTNVTIPSGVTVIGQSAFSDCRSLQSISIPSGVTVLESGLFEYCDYLTSLVIPDGVTRIESDAFFVCSALSSLTIPASVTEIGPFAINGCISLTDVYYGGTEAQWREISIDESNTSLDNAEIHFLAIPLAVSDITANKSSANTGETITWTAAATGGAGALRYCFYVYQGSTVVYNSGYGSASSVSYTPMEAGSYKVKVFVKDGAGKSTSRMSNVITVSAASTPITITGLNADKTSAVVGAKITWTAAASGGNGTLRYCFYVYQGSTVVYNSGYGAATSVSYTPTEAGAYKAKVFVKDSMGKSATRLSGVTTVTAADTPITITGLSADKASAAVGTKITWTAAASGGTGTLRYCFYVYQGSTVVYNSGYGAATSVSYTPTEAGSYKAKVFVKDSMGKSATRLSGVTAVTGGDSPISITSLTVSKTAAAVGEPLVWLASASGGTGTLQYCFYIYRDGAVVQKGGYGTVAAFSYTPLIAGTYTAKVFVKDSAGKSSTRTGGNCIVG